MLRQPRELAVLIQTRLTLVVALASGHDPVKASGLLFAYLAGICKRAEPDKPQVWQLNAADRAGEDAWNVLRRVADHQNRDATAVWNESRLDDPTLATDPLSD
jgi:hypothetical protein